MFYYNMSNPLILIYDFPAGFEFITLPVSPVIGITSIDWGDGITNTTIPHTYTSAGTYTVRIYGSGITDMSNVDGTQPGGKNTCAQYLTQCTSFGNIGLTNLNAAFAFCYRLTNVPTTLPLQITVLSNTFSDSSYNSVEISGWNVDNVTTTAFMFVRSEFNQPLNNWNVSNVTNMEFMFYQSKFNQPLNNWNVSNVTNMQLMFYNTPFNQDIGNWNVENVTNMSSMFYNTPFNQNISSWNVANATDMSYMFYSSPFNQPLIWNVGNVTSMLSMFQNAPVFDQDISSWDVSNVTTMAGMFFGATAYDYPLNGWDVSKVTDMSYMFDAASSFDQPLNNWNVSKVTNMMYMFYNAIVFNQPLNNWNVSKVTNMGNMFNGATLFNGDMFSNTVIVTDMSRMFYDATAFNKPLNNCNVFNVTTMSQMFEGASSFNQPLNNWNVFNVTNMGNMFFGATVFNQPINSWNVGNVTNMAGMFENTTAFNQDISDWNISNVTTMTNLFVLTSLSIYNYNKLLNKWSTLNVESNVGLITNGLIFTPVGEVGRNRLIQHNWNIQGDVLAPSNIYQSTNFDLTYYKYLSLGITYDLYFFNIKVSSVICSAFNYITFTNINTSLKGKIFVTIVTGNTVLFGGYLTTTIVICRPPIIIKPEYSFSEQVSSSDRVKQLKDQVINCNIFK